MDEIPRSRQARAAAEQALVRVVHHYGTTPEFVVLGGLVPELLCSGSGQQHAGTTDIDVQVNLEIECGEVNTKRLEGALKKAGFEPDNEEVWRWRVLTEKTRAVVKFELFADRDDEPASKNISFENCEQLGALNLRGTRYAVEDIEVRTLTASVDGKDMSVEINVTGVAGFLLAKCAAARARQLPKDWYDIAFVLLHNDLGGTVQAANAVIEKFGKNLKAMETPLAELAANFAGEQSQGPAAYADQMMQDDPGLDIKMLKAIAITAVNEFCEAVRQ